MPFHVNSQNNDDPKYTIRFRGNGMIPRINHMAPDRLQLTMKAIEEILESLHRRPMRIEVKYIDSASREWELNYGNFRKIILSDNPPAEDDEDEKPIGDVNIEDLPDLGGNDQPGGNVNVDHVPDLVGKPEEQVEQKLDSENPEKPEELEDTKSPTNESEAPGVDGESEPEEKPEGEETSTTGDEGESENPESTDGESSNIPPATEDKPEVVDPASPAKYQPNPNYNNNGKNGNHKSGSHKNRH